MDPALEDAWRRRFMEVYEDVVMKDLFDLTPLQAELDRDPVKASKRFRTLLHLVRKGSSVKAAAKAVGMNARRAQQRIEGWYDAAPQGAQGERWRRRFDT